MNGVGSANRTSLRWAVWPLTAVAITVVLIRYGRYLVTGLMLAIALAFLLAVAGVLLWAFLSMVQSGSRRALPELPRSLGQAKEAVGRGWQAVALAVGQAPWRRPQRMISKVIADLGDEVFELPSGRVAYSHLNVRLDPVTLRALDRFMAIEEIARIWAQHYVESQPGAARQIESATVTISSAQLPRGRARIVAGFRDEVAEDTWAWARCPWPVAGRRPGRDSVEVVRLRREGSPSVQPAADRAAAPAQQTVLEHDATVRLGAGIRPEAPGGSASHPARGGWPASDPTQPMHLTHTLGLQRVDPSTGKPISRPFLATAPRATIGRGPGMDLRINDPSVSREHAELRWIGERWTITDNGSTHGSTVNGERLAPGVRCALADGAALTIGDTTKGGTPTFRIHLDPDPARGDR